MDAFGKARLSLSVSCCEDFTLTLTLKGEGIFCVFTSTLKGGGDFAIALFGEKLPHLGDCCRNGLLAIVFDFGFRYSLVDLFETVGHPV